MVGELEQVRRRGCSSPTQTPRGHASHAKILETRNIFLRMDSQCAVQRTTRTQEIDDRLQPPVVQSGPLTREWENSFTPRRLPPYGELIGTWRCLE